MRNACFPTEYNFRLHTKVESLECFGRCKTWHVPGYLPFFSARVNTSQNIECHHSVCAEGIIVYLWHTLNDQQQQLR